MRLRQDVWPQGGQIKTLYHDAKEGLALPFFYLLSFAKKEYIYTYPHIKWLTISIHSCTMSLQNNSGGEVFMYSERVERFAAYLPSLKQLKDERTADAVCGVWEDMLRKSPWKSVEEARFKEGYDNVSLVSHVNSTVECALSLSRIIHRYHGIEFDEQLIIAFGLLHDVDKVVEYEFNEAGELVKSKLANQIQHGVLSAILAYENGFDADMLHMILTHTTESKMRPQIKEAILFGYADLCDWDLVCRYAAR